MQKRAVWILGVVLGAPGIAAAQDVADAAYTADEITVFGSARDERRLLETPNAVTVIDEAEVQRRQPSTYEELIGDAPGVTIGGGPRGMAQEPNIRGFQDEQVVIRVDGARQNFNLAHRGRFFVDPDSLKRVEILRGGQSTLFGSGALGGVILLETKDAADVLDPEDVWGGRLKLGFNSQGSEILASGTLAAQAGDFDAIGFLTYRPMGDDLTDGAGDDILNSELDVISGQFKLGYEPGDHRFEVSYQRYEDEGLTPPNANAAATATNVVNRDLSYQTARLDWSWSPEGSDLLDIDALVYFNEADVTEARPSDGRNDETTYTTFGLDVVNRSDVDLGLPVRLSYGVEAFRDEQEAERNGAARLSSPDAEATYLSAFVQGDVELGSGFTLTPGLRFDYFSVEPDGNFPDLSESQVSPKLALQWRPTETTQFWISASQSFRAPSLTELYNDGVHFSVGGFGLGPGTVFTGNNLFVPTPDLDPERASQLEIGGRLQDTDVMFGGDILTLSANAYYSRVDDYVDTVVSFIDFSTATFNPITGNLEVSGTTVNRNVDATLWGVEAELDYDADDWFASVGVTIPRGLNRAGGDLGSIPQDRVVITGGIRPFEDFEMGARATLLDGQDDVDTNGSPTPGVAIFDLFATYNPSEGPLEGISFAAGIDNVTDREYRLHPNDLNQPGIAFKASAAIEF